MDIVKQHSPGLDFLENEEKVGGKAKSSLRIQYEAQAEVIRKQIGDLSKIRGDLGLSQRKICQLLLVDPSAWTRWIEEGAPPHIWRALQWYMILQEKIPGLTPSYFLGKDPSSLHESALRALDVEKRRTEGALVKIEKQIQNEVDKLRHQNQDLLNQIVAQKSEYLNLVAKLKAHQKNLRYSLSVSLMAGLVISFLMWRLLR